MTGKHNTTEQWYRDRAMTRSNAPEGYDGFTPMPKKQKRKRAKGKKKREQRGEGK